MADEFAESLTSVINKHSQENGSNTPDFILAAFLNKCLVAFNETSRQRETWYGKGLSVGGGNAQPPSDRSLEIAARVWCDPKMKEIVMDTRAAIGIAAIIDAVIKSQTQPRPVPILSKI